jgi:hypothetical protein
MTIEPFKKYVEAGAPECWVNGYDDGQDNPFSQDKHKECLFDVE